MNRRLYAFLITAILLLALDSAVHRAPVSSASPPLNDGAIVVQVQTGINCANVTEIPTTECNALVALYNSTNGANWINQTGWLVTVTPCSWFGVRCSNGHVNALALRDNQLSGTLPAQVGDLPEMLFIDMTRNQLSGSIPTQLGNLTKLRSLELPNNQLSGNIPTQLGNLTGLIVLNLCCNQLTGSIPTQLGNLTILGELTLSGNQLTGSIPAQLGNLTPLAVLGLCCNQLSGNVPSQLGNLTRLTFLSLDHNQLSGQVATQLGNLINLTELHLENNLSLSEALPSSLTNLNQLATFWFNNTNLCEPGDATFQAWLASIPNVQRTGVLCTPPPSAEFDAWPQSGNTPFTVAMHIVSTANISNCTWEYGDAQTGNSCANYHDHIYTSAGTYTVKLTVSGPGGSDTMTRNNYIVVSAQTSCYTLTTNVNPANGGAVVTTPAPNCQGNMYMQGTVVSLSATANPVYEFSQWSGDASSNTNPLNVTMDRNKNITANFREKPFSCNNVTEIPQIECEALVAFYNSTNGPAWTNPSGWLVTLTPCSWFGLTCSNNHVTTLSLANNHLGGNVTSQLDNPADQTGPDLVNNQQSGNIPPQLGNLVDLTELRLSNNQLSGNIPPEIGNLINLRYLYLDNNQFSGTLPGGLINLTKLDTFSFNNSSLCEPGDATFQGWLAGIPNLNHTGTICAVADFDASPLSGNAPLIVSFHNSSTGNITSCVWDHGDNTTDNSCASDHTHTYTSAGSYPVKLTVSGSSHSDTKAKDNYITVLEGSSITVTVPGTSVGTNTGIIVAIGDQIDFIATGSVNTWPPGSSNWGGPDGNPYGCNSQCLLPSARFAALIGRIGNDGEWFLVGSQKTMTAERNGTLILAINDLGGNTDNIGEFTVTIMLRTNALPPKAWTLMFYLAGDNDDLDTGNPSALRRYLDHLILVNNPNINIAALYDGREDNDSGYYGIDDNLTFVPKGELNTGDPQTLVDFVDWARKNLPSSHTALIIFGHGKGLVGVARDDSSASDVSCFTLFQYPDCLTMKDLSSAFSQIVADHGKLDVLFMQACYMGTIEAAYQVRDAVDYFVASEHLVHASLPFYLSSITSSTEPESLARDIATDYHNFAAPRDYDHTISVGRLSNLPNLVSRLNTLAQLLRSRMPAQNVRIRRDILSQVQYYDSIGNGSIERQSDELIDIYDFARLVNEKVSDQEIRDAAQAVMNALQDDINPANRYIVYEEHSSNLQWQLDQSHGVSIFTPRPGYRRSFYIGINLDFASGTDWGQTSSSFSSETTAAALIDIIEWGPMLVEYVRIAYPDAPDDPIPPDLSPLSLPKFVYLPFIVKGGN